MMTLTFCLGFISTMQILIMNDDLDFLRSSAFGFLHLVMLLLDLLLGFTSTIVNANPNNK